MRRSKRTRKFRLTSSTAERKLRAKVRARLKRLRKLVEKRAEKAFSELRTDSIRTDAGGYDPASLRRMWVRIAGEPVEDAESVAQTVVNSVDRSISSAVKAVVPDARPLPDPMDVTAAAVDVAGRIRSLEDAYIEKIAKRLEDVAKKEMTQTEFRSMLTEEFGLADRKAELLARDQVGSMEARVAAERAQEAGVPKYIWRTQRDERVRDEHQDREGEVFEWANPPPDGHPGEPVNCRCFSEPFLDSILEGL